MQPAIWTVWIAIWHRVSHCRYTSLQPSPHVALRSEDPSAARFHRSHFFFLVAQTAPCDRNCPLSPSPGPLQGRCRRTRSPGTSGEPICVVLRRIIQPTGFTAHYTPSAHGNKRRNCQSVHPRFDRCYRIWCLASALHLWEVFEQARTGRDNEVSRSLGSRQRPACDGVSGLNRISSEFGHPCDVIVTVLHLRASKSKPVSYGCV